MVKGSKREVVIIVAPWKNGGIKMAAVYSCTLSLNCLQDNAWYVNGQEDRPNSSTKKLPREGVARRMYYAAIFSQIGVC